MRVRSYLWLLLPISTFLVVTFFWPVGLIFWNTIFTRDQGFTLSAYWEFIRDPLFRQVFWRTLQLGVMVTTLAVIMAYPVAFVLYRLGGRWRSFLLALVVFPLLTNPVVRSYSWMVVLGKFGFINSLLTGLGIVNDPLQMLYTPRAVVLGLVHLFLPLMVLSLVSAMENIHQAVLEAAESLGASPLRAFWTTVVPLTLPGLVMGVALVFTGSITAYVTPHMLGGSRVLMLSTLLYQQAMVVFDWNAATVIAAISTLLTLAVVLVMGAIARRKGVQA